MKISKYIIISIIFICMTAQGAITSRICMGSTHSDATIDWAMNCHPQTTGAHDSHPHSLGHQDSNCIDILISAAAGSSGNPRPDDQLNLVNLANPVFLTPAAAEHPFSSHSSLKTILFPGFTDSTRISIASTILII